MAERLNITRRDFLNGVALSLAAGTTLSPLEILAKTRTTEAYYPPSLTGLRGSHAGSFEIAHAVAMAGAKFDYPQEQTDATYDLVVVGGGISGLAAAFLFRQQAGPAKRVLVLDNHDDFGGHATRNEFDVDGKRLIGYGGSQSLEAPSMYSPAAARLLKDIGIHVERFYEYFDRQWRDDHSLRQGIYFSKEAYGEDLTRELALQLYGYAPDYTRLEDAVAGYPLSDAAKAGLIRLMESEDDFLPDLTRDEKIDLLRRISYSDYLREYVGIPEKVVALVRDTARDYWGVGWDAVSALEAYRYQEPGTWGLDLELGERGLHTSDEPYIFHFPDGNAGVARALVRALLPDAVPGTAMEDLVTARVDYAALDEAASSARIRLNSTAVDVRHAPDQKYVDVTYVRGGQTERVRCRHAVLACNNNLIPHICGEVSQAQAEGLAYGSRAPLVYVNIAVRNWRPFRELGFYRVFIPQPTLLHVIELDFPVSMGDYGFTTGPDQPAVLHGCFVPAVPDQGLSSREQARQGRRRMLEMSFDDYEKLMLRQLDGALGRAGFDAERDVAAITVNRWPHGYAYEYNELYDPPDYDRDHGPHVTGRQRIGRISIANSDASAYAYVDGAIDAAVRAVREQLEL